MAYTGIRLDAAAAAVTAALIVLLVLSGSSEASYCWIKVNDLQHKHLDVASVYGASNGTDGSSVRWLKDVKALENETVRLECNQSNEVILTLKEKAIAGDPGSTYFVDVIFDRIFGYFVVAFAAVIITAVALYAIRRFKP